MASSHTVVGEAFRLDACRINSSRLLKVDDPAWLATTARPYFTRVFGVAKLYINNLC